MIVSILPFVILSLRRGRENPVQKPQIFFCIIRVFSGCSGRLLRSLLSMTVVVLLLSNQAFAKDFGIQGHVFPIQEENILKVIEARLQKVDLDKLNKELKDKTKKYVENPPVLKGITKATELKVKYYDPTFTNPSDIYDHNGLLIAPKGKTVNPLEFTLLNQPLVFIDGDDEKQVIYGLSHKNAKIILVKGSPLKLQRKHKRWIYFDQAGVITTKLGIGEVPALVEQEELKLKITIGGTHE